VNEGPGVACSLSPIYVFTIPIPGVHHGPILVFTLRRSWCSHSTDLSVHLGPKPAEEGLKILVSAVQSRLCPPFFLSLSARFRDSASTSRFCARINFASTCLLSCGPPGLFPRSRVGFTPGHGRSTWRAPALGQLLRARARRGFTALRLRLVGRTFHPNLLG